LKRHHLILLIVMMAPSMAACGLLAVGESQGWQMMRRPADGARMVCTQMFSTSPFLGSGEERARARVAQCASDLRRQGFVEVPSDSADRRPAN
jgi:hypothetical protein